MWMEESCVKTEAGTLERAECKATRRARLLERTRRQEPIAACNGQLMDLSLLWRTNN